MIYGGIENRVHYVKAETHSGSRALKETTIMKKRRQTARTIKKSVDALFEAGQFGKGESRPQALAARTNGLHNVDKEEEGCGFGGSTLIRGRGKGE